MPDPTWSQLLLQVVLILLNAFFAATEIAFLSLNEKKFQKLSEEGDKKAEKMLKVIEKLESFLSTIQIGITLSGYLASAFAANNFSEKLVNWLANTFQIAKTDALRTTSVVLVTLVLSFFTLVFGELVPKRIAMQKAEKVASMASGVMRFVSVIAKPIIWLLSVSTNGVLRLMRIDPNQKDDEVTEDEIRMMVDIGEEKGTIESTEKEMIENIFEFNNMTAADVMTHRTDMNAIWIGENDEEIIKTISESGLSRFPVFDEDIDSIIGVISTREYLLNSRLPKPKLLTELLRAAYFVPETVPTDMLFRDMQTKKIHMAIVLDEYGGTSGLVTMEDLLEEIVGNIYDEFDPLVEKDIIQIDENKWKVAGYVELEALSEVIGSKWLGDYYDFDTVGGLVYSKLNEIPEDGREIEVTVNNLTINVESMLDRRVEWTIITKNCPDPEETDKLERSEKNGKDK